MFIAMDIFKQTKNLIETTLTNGTCEGMNINEYRAYEMGIFNTLSALQVHLTSYEDELIVHVDGKEDIEEMCARELCGIKN